MSRSALQWLSHPTSDISHWNSFLWVYGIHYQLFSSLLHALSFVSQSESSDVTLGSSRMISIIYGDYLNTLSSLKHRSRTIHWLLTYRIDDVPKYQSHGCSKTPPLKSRNILSEIAERSEWKSWDTKNSKFFSPQVLFVTIWRSPGTLLDSFWECRQLHSVSLWNLPDSWSPFQFSLDMPATSPNFLQRSSHITLPILIPVLFGCLDVADTQTWCWSSVGRPGFELTSLGCSETVF